MQEVFGNNMSRTYGIDIGTTFITVWERSMSLPQRYRHEGRIHKILQQIIKPLAPGDVCVFTGKSGREIAAGMKGAYFDEAVALSCMLSSEEEDPFFGRKGQVIDIGASSLTLYTIKEGKVTDITRNTLCAAGTGLFLEEQAERLNINLEEPWDLAIDDPPLIASRCTVFAKSDLIHHQQEGRSKAEMWAGLCRSLVVSAVNTLFRGEELKGRIMICGGVSLNREVMRWFEKLYPAVEWLEPTGSSSEAAVAMGASLLPGTPVHQLHTDFRSKKKKFNRMPALTLKRSQYPPMPASLTDEFNNEIRIHGSLESAAQLFLGMDIGSTSTKLAVLDAHTREPLLDIYGRTAGDPVGAAKKIFASFFRIMGKRNIPVLAFGTTGSGRKLVGEIFGADLIVNEISAHGKGTAHFYPDVETIFEIGGQDAKYIRLQDGYVADVNMNYVCAAGTGSFIEEQARKLGFNVHEIGDITTDIAPPVTSDRCTVFMEQDLRALLKEGFTKEEALASVLYSIIQNYLNRVVGNRPINDKKIFFQGATARNTGLVAALENLLDVEVTVSPYCHLMGAIGAALRAGEYTASVGCDQSLFVGPEAVDMQISSRSDLCKLCRNFCRINYVSRLMGNVSQNTPEFSWGYQCGRDAEEKLRREVPEYDLFKQRIQAFKLKHSTNKPQVKGVVTLVNALTNYTFQPLWEHFFSQLGYQVKNTGQTDSKVKKESTNIASADFCFPVKVVLGHLVKALTNQPADHLVFLPYLIADKASMTTTHSYYCPYVESSASIVKSTLSRSGVSTHNLLSPVIDFRDNPRDIAEIIYQHIKDRMKVKKKDVLAAFKQAHAYWRTQQNQLEQLGTQFLESMQDSDQPIFILVGRPYNLHDNGVILGLPEKIAARGFPVIPVDMLQLDPSVLAEQNYYNVFWKYGQRIIAAIKTAARYRNVFPIYFSNFNCGPDSFLLTFAEEELKGKPMLILELDEHDSDGGYLTRVEAFIDVVLGYMNEEPPVPHAAMPQIFTVQRKTDMNGRVWIPPMHIATSHLYAAAFRHYGYDSASLETEDQETLVLGKKQLRGGECLPMTLTMGGFLKQIKHKSGQRQILLMPTSEGPCRFGQYNLLERVVFHRMGLENVDIISPSSINSYQGLPEGLRRLLMHATMSGDMLYKMLTRVRPYEKTRGDAMQLFTESLTEMEQVLESGRRPLKAIGDIAAKFASINVYKEKKPLVGIVGEIYVRCNHFANGNLVDVIEASGGEAWLTPIHEWLIYTAFIDSIAARNRRGGLLKRGGSWVNNFYIFKTEKNYYEATARLLKNREEPHIREVVAAGARYLPEEFEGESILTIGRAVLFAQQGASMVVNASPFSCMPGTLASSILLEIKEKYDIPMLSLFYDGDIQVNDKVASLLKSIILQDSHPRQKDLPQFTA